MFGGIRKSWRTWKQRYFILRNPEGWGGLPRVWSSKPRKCSHVVLIVEQASKVDILWTKAYGGEFDCNKLIEGIEGRSFYRDECLGIFFIFCFAFYMLSVNMLCGLYDF